MKKQNVIHIMLAGGLAVGLLMLSPKAFADDNAQLKDQVQSLQNRGESIRSAISK